MSVRVLFRHSRESGSPVAFNAVRSNWRAWVFSLKSLGPRFRGDDGMCGGAGFRGDGGEGSLLP